MAEQTLNIVAGQSSSSVYNINLARSKLGRWDAFLGRHFQELLTSSARPSSVVIGAAHKEASVSYYISSSSTLLHACLLPARHHYCSTLYSCLATGPLAIAVSAGIIESAEINRDIRER
jgi:hypothetical protein